MLARVMKYNKATYALIRRMYAKDATDDEFNQFMIYAEERDLCPLKKQIYFTVFNKNDPAKRQWVAVIGIEGFRAIAARTGNYRPDEKPPRITANKSAITDDNPEGLVKATVKIHVWMHGEWHAVTGVAHWNEYAPYQDETRWSDETGRYERTGKRVLNKDKAGFWIRMPRAMLSKIAEVQALKKAFPESYPRAYEQAEVDRVVDLLPSEYAVMGEVEERLRRIRGPSIILNFTGDNEAVPVGKVTDRVMDFLQKNKASPRIISDFQNRNQFALREFWAHHAGDAVAIRKEIDRIVKQ
jgi:phage recombination protein Bet